jgi:hypothetical protein
LRQTLLKMAKESMEDVSNETAPLGVLAQALRQAQKKFGPIKKTKEGGGGKYTYRYAPMEELLNATREPLGEQGLTVSQPVEGNKVNTFLIHDNGARLESWMCFPENLTPQDVGGWVSYLRRYLYAAILAIAAEEDTDAQNVGEGAQSRRGDDDKGMKCPNCNKPDTVVVVDLDWHKGPYCVRKKGGCGAKWSQHEWDILEKKMEALRVQGDLIPEGEADERESD